VIGEHQGLRNRIHPDTKLSGSRRPAARVGAALPIESCRSMAFVSPSTIRYEEIFRIYQRARTEAKYNAIRFLHMLDEHRGLETARILLRFLKGAVEDYKLRMNRNLYSDF
jgi:hypothetical protein